VASARGVLLGAKIGVVKEEEYDDHKYVARGSTTRAMATTSMQELFTARLVFYATVYNKI
jgi:hypothetical protein